MSEENTSPSINFESLFEDLKKSVEAIEIRVENLNILFSEQYNRNSEVESVHLDNGQFLGRLQDGHKNLVIVIRELYEYFYFESQNVIARFITIEKVIADHSKGLENLRVELRGLRRNIPRQGKAARTDKSEPLIVDVQNSVRDAQNNIIRDLKARILSLSDARCDQIEGCRELHSELVRDIEQLRTEIIEVANVVQELIISLQLELQDLDREITRIKGNS